MSLRHASLNRRCACASIIALALALGGTASAQGFDAGAHANLLHQQELLRNQTTGDGDGPKSADRNTPASESRVQWHLKNLRPEYQRRLRANGKADADAWSARALRGLLERDRRLGVGDEAKR